MKKLIRKIKNRSGETIGETLVALLVSSLALAMLAGAIMASSGIITKSSNKINEYYRTSNTMLEEMDTSGTVTFEETSTDGTASKSTINIGVYSEENSSLNSSSPVIAFKWNPNGNR